METVDMIKEAKARSLKRSFDLYQKAKADGSLKKVDLTKEQKKLLRPLSSSAQG